MHKRTVIRHIKHARDKVSIQIRNDRRSGGKYARGLASEGYNGGYRDALNDVLLLLESDTIPDRRFYDSDRT